MAQRTCASPSRRVKYQWPLGWGLSPTTSPRSQSAGICPCTMRFTAALNWETDIASSVGLIRESWVETAIAGVGRLLLARQKLCGYSPRRDEGHEGQHQHSGAGRLRVLRVPSCSFVVKSPQE